MKHAETVTFGGSGLDRAADVRADAEALSQLRRKDSARAILFWRGKPLIHNENPAYLLMKHRHNKYEESIHYHLNNDQPNLLYHLVLD